MTCVCSKNIFEKGLPSGKEFSHLIPKYECEHHNEVCIDLKSYVAMSLMVHQVVTFIVHVECYSASSDHLQAHVKCINSHISSDDAL